MTNKEDFTKWSEELCSGRREVLIRLRKEKAGKNPIKKWFYLGKKIKLTRYSVVSSDWVKIAEGLKSFEEAREVGGKIVPCSIDGYSVEGYVDTPYDKFRWRAFKKWQRKVERKGVEIKREYMYDGKAKYKLWKSSNWDNTFRKFTKYWWKEVLDNLKRKFRSYRVCTYDYYDIFTNLIVNLTIKGMFLGLYGSAVTHKEQMHEIWECRKELIKAYNFEEYYEHKCKIDILSDKPDFSWYQTRDEKYKECLNKAFALMAKDIRDWWD